MSSKSPHGNDNGDRRSSGAVENEAVTSFYDILKSQDLEYMRSCKGEELRIVRKYLKSGQFKALTLGCLSFVTLRFYRNRMWQYLSQSRQIQAKAKSSPWPTDNVTSQSSPPKVLNSPFAGPSPSASPFSHTHNLTNSKLATPVVSKFSYGFGLMVDAMTGGAVYVISAPLLLDNDILVNELSTLPLLEEGSLIADKLCPVVWSQAQKLERAFHQGRDEMEDGDSFDQLQPRQDQSSYRRMQPQLHGKPVERSDLQFFLLFAQNCQVAGKHAPATASNKESNKNTNATDW